MNIRLDKFVWIFAAGKGCMELREITEKCPIIAPIPTANE